MKHYLYLFALWLFAAPLWGQSDSARLELKQLGAEDLLLPAPQEAVEVVTATRSGGRSLEDFPVTVYVVPKEEIRLNGYTTLIDVLKSVPGMKVSKPGTGELGEMFVMRGLVGNQYAKILIDGIPIQPSVMGSIGIGEQLPIAQAEKIEIIYGPAATVYGSDAMAGVINIITEQVDQGSLARGTMVTGRDGYRQANFMVGGKLGRNKDVVTYTLYANMGKRNDMNIRHDGHVFNSFDYAVYNVFRGQISDDEAEALRNLPEDQQAQVVDIYRQNGFVHYQGGAFRPTIGDLPQQSYLVGARLNYRNLQVTLNEMYRRDHSTLGRTPIIFSYADPNNFVGERIQRATVTYHRTWSKIGVTLNGSLLRYRTEEQSSWGSNYATGYGNKSYFFRASDDIFLEGLFTYTPNANWDLLVGLTHQESSNMPTTNDLESAFSTEDYRPFTNHRPEPHPLYGDFGYNPLSYVASSAFFQGFYHKERWSFLAGIRLIWAGNYQVPETSSDFFLFNSFANRLTPRLGALYKLSKVSSVRVSVATGFRLPPTDRAFASLALPGIDFAGNIIPNKVNYQVVPSEELQPEISNSAELGYRYLFTNKIYADATLFGNWVRYRINNDFVRLDPAIYPDAVLNYIEPDGTPSSRARQWQNGRESQSYLAGLQLMLRARDILPRHQLGVDAFLQIANGNEIWPTGERLNAYRSVPQRMLQLSVSMVPVKNMYVRIENVWSSKWYRRNLQSEEDLSYPYAETGGFFTTDWLARYQLSKHLQTYIKVTNVFNAQYGGIGASGQDVDLFYTPQLLRNIQVGITFEK